MAAATPQDHMYKARETWAAETAFRAAKDPVRVRRSLRIVRAALTTGVVTYDELTPLIDPNGSDQ